MKLSMFMTTWTLLMATPAMLQVMPSQSVPPWATMRGVADITSTEKPITEAFYSGWPWWWWIAAVTGASVLFVVLIAVCVCCCCYIRAIKKRSRVVLAESGRSGELPETGGLENPALNHADFRRKSNSPAKRYLHNIVSIFSWGSEFDREETLRPSPISNPVYANPKEMRNAEESNHLVVPPSRPPRYNENHYLNISPVK